MRQQPKELDGAPDSLRSLHAAAWERGHGADDDRTRFAWRCVYLAGWVNTPAGWRKLAPDVLGKVNVRRAFPQPNGKAFVPDVDVFYPNAVKGAGFAHTDAANAGRIENTNRAVAEGGQAPGLTRGHPTAMQRAMGVCLPSLGQCVNWRPSPRGLGMVRCDIADVDPSAAREWAEGKWTGLSVGLVEDAEGLNERFGHVALLGGESQALSLLPRTELYAAGSQVCFSAEPAGYATEDTKGPDPMSMKNLAPLFAAVAAAMSSYAAGEPGAGAKVKDAGGKFAAGVQAFDASAAMTEPQGTGVVTQDPQEVTHLPAVPAQMPGEHVPMNVEFASSPEGDNYAAEMQDLRTRLQTRDGQIGQLVTIVRGLADKTVTTEFSAFVDDLDKNNHALPARDFIDQQFAAAKADAHPKQAVERLKAFLGALPKKSLADVPTVFGAGGGSSALKGTRQDDPEAVIRELGQYVGGNIFAAADKSHVDIGSLVSEALAGAGIGGR